MHVEGTGDNLNDGFSRNGMENSVDNSMGDILSYMDDTLQLSLQRYPANTQACVVPELCCSMNHPFFSFIT